jgi:hypothetical protein
MKRITEFILISFKRTSILVSVFYVDQAVSSDCGFGKESHPNAGII